MRSRPGQVHDESPDLGLDSAPGAVLDATALVAIRDANLQFLDLLCAPSADAARFGLPGPLAGRLGALDAEARRSVAGCPYTLFDLRFADAAFWRHAAAFVVKPAPGLAEAACARTGVLLAWHLATRGELTVAVALGASAATHRALLALPLSSLEHAAAAALPSLLARWGGHPAFWPGLLGVGSSRGAARAASARLLGLQLLAADGLRPPGSAAGTA